MKTLSEWALGIAGTVIGILIGAWTVRGFIFKYLEEKGAGKKALQKEEDARKLLEKTAEELVLQIKKIELDIDALKERMTRTSKFVDNNYEDLRELDEKVERLRQIQDSKLL